jgi:hypothetical protein
MANRNGGINRMARLSLVIKDQRPRTGAAASAQRLALAYSSAYGVSYQ